MDEKKKNEEEIEGVGGGDEQEVTIKWTKGKIMRRRGKRRRMKREVTIK